MTYATLLPEPASQKKRDGFSLQLRSLHWSIYGTAAASSWLGELARITQMERTATGGCPEIYCVRGFDDIKNIEGSAGDKGLDIAAPGWRHTRVWTSDVWTDEGARHMIFDIGEADDEKATAHIKMLIFMYAFYGGIISSGGLPIHGGLIEKGGRGAILAGRGQIGKSTCCRRISGGWHALCDDETMAMGENGSDYSGYPFPTWSDYIMRSAGKIWDIKKGVPIKGIFFLVQSTEDDVVPVEKLRAPMYIYDSAMQKCHAYFSMLDRERSNELKRLVFNNACQLSKSVPAYMLHVSLNGRFWEKIEDTLGI